MSVAVFNESFEQRRCDVVGKIGDEMKWSGRKVHLQGVAFDDFDIGGMLPSKRRNQIPIDLDGDDALSARRPVHA